MVFAKLLERARALTAKLEAPQTTAAPKPDVPPPAPPTKRERVYYEGFVKAIKVEGVNAISSASFRHAFDTAPEDPAQRLATLTRHPDFFPVVEALLDLNEQREDDLIALLRGLKDYGLTPFVPESLASAIKNRSTDPNDDHVEIRRHPAFRSTVLKYAELAKTQTPAEASAANDRAFFEFIFKLEQDAFGDPSRLLTYDDMRPLGWQGMRLRWSAHYKRVAGTMNERERFVYLFGYACEWTLERSHTDPEIVQAAVAQRVTAALNAGPGIQEWRLDPDYIGDRAKEFKKAAQQHFAPETVDHYFQQDASKMLEQQRAGSTSPLVHWAIKKLQPKSSGWASSR